MSWVLKGYPSDRGLCLDLAVSGPVNSSGGACGFAVPGDETVGSVVDRLYEPSHTFVYGPVTVGVRRVTVATRDGASYEVAAVPGPTTLRGVDFYVAAIPRSALIEEIIARDGSGNVVGRVVVDEAPPPDPASF